MIKTIVSDGGRAAHKPDEKLDCAVRALAVALRESFTYGQVHDIFSWLGRKPRHKSYCTDVTFSLFGLTFKWVGCTLAQFVRAHSTGRHVVRFKGHLAVIENGALVDLGSIGARKRVISYATVNPL